jgi:hypothetical protein
MKNEINLPLQAQRAHINQSLRDILRKSYIAYYFHWSQNDILNLEHTTRQRWVAEIINNSKFKIQNSKLKTFQTNANSVSKS